ncbi:hypothetical protein SAMN05216559_2591 [Halomicrobium zhouii]|uniref:DUF7575 domain-containing protein n=1 Tax=Halomicrobium zhouii TaxID=767519 RepID=A0A1I6LF31_9EURY|nr:zinc ribbon domain-containing protein [Halomicrobium zhouii]SFS02057.1 hypothetical protein SAMN05216559_2591 [Halomicrobium zhouii]
MAETKRRRPWLAAALALLSPGLGHVYLREWLRAVVWFGLMFAATELLVPVPPMPAEVTVTSVLEASQMAAEQVDAPSRLALFAITALSMADAYWIATRGNRQAATDEGVSCPHCGREVDEDLEFCHWCTTRLEPLE